MNGFAILFTLVNSIALPLLPRRCAVFPLLICTFYMTPEQIIVLGPFHFTVLRIFITVSFIRIVFRSEWRLNGRMKGLDWLMIAYAVWSLISSAFHQEPSEALVFRLGMVYNFCGLYYIFRTFCQTLEDIEMLIYMIAILLLPLGIEMLSEKMTGRNFFAFLGGVPEFSAIRHGHIRAQGPFSHSILAGTVGAVCLPFVTILFQHRWKVATIGVMSCLTIVVCSASSGPIVSLMAAIVALIMWQFRQQMRAVRWLSVIAYFTLDIFMKAPAYYLIARIDLAGGSTGWHRAELIHSAIVHINEWWIAGTDYTRHWMPTGVSWSENHADITNGYLNRGVLGGMPLMIIFIAILTKGFSYVGDCVHNPNCFSNDQKYMIWTFGAGLFAHTVTLISVSYFDQSLVFLCLSLAGISSIWSIKEATAK